MPSETLTGATIDREAATADTLQLRVWLRLLTCTHMIEGNVRALLRSEFATTLPRFDVLAQLESADGVLTMGELSTRLMVTSGNVTGLVNAMERDGLVSRRPHPTDRRSTLIRMTTAGRTLFRKMAPAHQAWIDSLMGSLSRPEMKSLLDLLGELKSSIRAGDA